MGVEDEKVNVEEHKETDKEEPNEIDRLQETTKKDAKSLFVAGKNVQVLMMDRYIHV